MADSATIKRIHDRNIKALKLRPSTGRGTSVTTARLTGGLACEISEGSWKFMADLGPGDGGDSKGPTPGVYGRGALASCLTMGIAFTAAQRGIALRGLSIEVAADWDAQGMYGLGDNVPPGYTALRVSVGIDSPASAQEIDELLADAVANSPYVDVFRRSHDMTVKLKAKAAA